MCRVCECYRGGIGDGCDLASTLCKYDLRKGDLFVMRSMYMMHVCIYVCCSDCVGVCGNVCYVAAVVKDSVFF